VNTWADGWRTTTITLGRRDDYGTGSIDTSYVAMPLLAAEV
jgi:hypothetical protein